VVNLVQAGIGKIAGSSPIPDCPTEWRLLASRQIVLVMLKNKLQPFAEGGRAVSDLTILGGRGADAQAHRLHTVSHLIGGSPCSNPPREPLLPSRSIVRP
jgi:hypothetical protein